MTSKADELPRIPVTIISGFLGSGKTTLLNHIISKNVGARIGVIVNDFGEIDIDANLIVSSSDQIMEISNGCICCSNNGDLRATVSQLLRDNADLGWVIIESTGIGDPLPILKTFMRPEFIRRLRVDSILTVVDAENIQQSILDSHVAQRQIRYADFVLLNKCDLVQRRDIDAVKSLVLDVNKECRILETINCSVQLDAIIGIGFHDKIVASDHEQTHAHSCGHECHDYGGGNHGFKSISYHSDELFDPQKFQRFLQDIPSGVFRAKGFLQTDQSNQSYIFHLIGRRFTLDADQAQRNPCNQIVFIGRHFDEVKLIDELKLCLAER